MDQCPDSATFRRSRCRRISKVYEFVVECYKPADRCYTESLGFCHTPNTCVERLVHDIPTAWCVAGDSFNREVGTTEIDRRILTYSINEMFGINARDIYDVEVVLVDPSREIVSCVARRMAIIQLGADDEINLGPPAECSYCESLSLRVNAPGKFRLEVRVALEGAGSTCLLKGFVFPSRTQ